MTGTQDTGSTIFRPAVVLLTAAMALSLVCPDPVGAQSIRTKATHVFMIEMGTGTVMLEKEADTPMAPASMAKIMTLAVIFERLKASSLKPDDEFTISEHAWRTGGAPSRTSSMFAEIHSSVKLGDLVQSIAVQSGNDACIAVAEGVAGSEAAFARIMTDHARKIGLKNSVFTNPTGLPDPDMHVTARDLALLAEHVITTYPDYYKVYSQKEFTWNKIRQYNRNRLLGKGHGVDGMKTGYTEGSGFGIVVTAKRDDQRLILVLNGLKTKKDRTQEAIRLLDWGFKAFEFITLFPAGTPVGEARVFGGEKSHVGLVARDRKAVMLLTPRGSRSRLSAQIVYKGPVAAPVEEGQLIGELRVFRDKRLAQTTPLFSAERVPEGSLQQRALDALRQLLFGWW